MNKDKEFALKLIVIVTAVLVAIFFVTSLLAHEKKKVPSCYMLGDCYATKLCELDKDKKMTCTQGTYCLTKVDCKTIDRDRFITT